MSHINVDLTALAKAIRECAFEDDRLKRINMATTILRLLKVDFEESNPKPTLSLIIDRDAKRELRMWACRGQGKGCKRNEHRTSRTHCDDCFGPLADDMTLEQVVQRLKDGDG